MVKRDANYNFRFLVNLALSLIFILVGGYSIDFSYDSNSNCFYVTGEINSGESIEVYLESNFTGLQVSECINYDESNLGIFNISFYDVSSLTEEYYFLGTSYFVGENCYLGKYKEEKNLGLLDLKEIRNSENNLEKKTSGSSSSSSKNDINTQISDEEIVEEETLEVKEEKGIIEEVKSSDEVDIKTNSISNDNDIEIGVLNNGISNDNSGLAISGKITSGKITSGKTTLIRAIIGLIIVVVIIYIFAIKRKI